jgi:type III pantothenate kinase
MLLAIDIGNTQTVVGLWDGSDWRSVWRRATSFEATEDELAVWLKSLFDLAGLPMQVDAVVVASVAPPANESIQRLCRKWLGLEPMFVEATADLGIRIDYQPASAVGADRVANALAASAKFKLPCVVVDFGTATTFDAISAEGAYLGGAILPGIEVSTQALVGRTAKLPQIEFAAPESAIGRTTVQSLQSGIMLGYAGAIDALTERISGEMGGAATVVATGGHGSWFMGLCKSLKHYEPNLTLDGLVIAHRRLSAS